MERYCSTGQSPQQAVAPTEEEEGDYIYHMMPHPKVMHFARREHIYISYNSQNKTGYISELG